MGNFALDEFIWLSKLMMWFLISCVKSVGLKSLVYREKMFSCTFFTLSILVANTTCVSAISLDIFSSTLFWNFFSDHSNCLTLVSRSMSLTLSTILVNYSMIGFVSSRVGRLNASRKMSLISSKACFCLCSLLRSSWCFFLARNLCSIPIYYIFITS